MTFILLIWLGIFLGIYQQINDFYAYFEVCLLLAKIKNGRNRFSKTIIREIGFKSYPAHVVEGVASGGN